MAETGNFLDALLPLAAFGGTLASGLNNYTVGPRAFESGMQVMNAARYWQQNAETQRQHQIAQLQHMGDAFVRVGDIAGAQRIDAEIQALGGQPGFADVAAARRARMQKADAIMASQMGSDLVVPPGPAASAQAPAPGPAPLLPPGAGVLTPSAWAQRTSPAVPDQETMTVPVEDEADWMRRRDALDAVNSQIRMQGMILDPSQHASGYIESDQSTADQQRMADLYAQRRALEQEPTTTIPAGPDYAAMDAELSDLDAARQAPPKQPPSQEAPTPAAPMPQSETQAPMAALPPAPTFPPAAQLKPAQAPFPGSINVNPETGEVSYNFTAEGQDRRTQALVQRAYQDQVARGVPPLAALNALTEAGYGPYTEGLQKRAFNETVAQLTRTYVGLGMDVRVARQQALQQALQAFPMGASDADRTASGQIFTRDQHAVMDAEQQARARGGSVASILDQREVEQAGKLAGEQADKRTRATNEAELDKPLELFPGGRAVWRKLDPGRYGEETVAPPEVANGRQAKQAGYLNVSAFEKQLDTARGLSDIFNWTNQLEKYAGEIIKAEPGFWNMTGQAAHLTLAKLANSGAPTSIPSMDGRRMLTLGEVATLYERELRGSQDFITRALGTVGTQTEGDVMRSAKNFAGLTDTKEVMQTLFHDLRSRVFARRMSLLSSAFGEKSVADAFPSARRDWNGRGGVPRDYTIPMEATGGMEVSPGAELSPGPASAPAQPKKSPGNSKLDKLFERAWVE